MVAETQPERALTDIERIANRVGEVLRDWPRESQSMAIVRAVLESLKEEPSTPLPLIAGQNALYSCADSPELEDARKCFHAIIDGYLEGAGRAKREPFEPVSRETPRS